MKPIILLALCWPSLIILPLVHAAELSVPRFEMASRGAEEDGKFILSSQTNADIGISGGYKFSAFLRFALDTRTGEESPTDTDSTLTLRLAKVSARAPFRLPLEFSYFVGKNDTFCSGDDFPALFGSAPIGSDFRGFAYFPRGIGGDPSYQYEGIHAANGTGLSLAYMGSKTIVPYLYLYQDAGFLDTEGAIKKGLYSADLRVLANTKKVKTEAFVGLSGPEASLGIYRIGALAFFSSGAGADFLAQVGIPFWDPSENLSVDDFYFLFEPRLSLGPAALRITLFYHPLHYLQRISLSERGYTDLNIKLIFGDRTIHPVEGGIETSMAFQTNSETNKNFSLAFSPFIGIATEGLQWDCKLRIDPLEYQNISGMFQTYLGVRTAF
ncbi:hypothetical protein MASR2M78_28130 [Treponema sp.]